MNEQVQKSMIIVDSREFSSTTPIHLHQKGFWLVPLQLTIGDYILSDDVCVERKSVETGDLFESFKSGRLLQQVTNMSQFYKKPILLIEFDEHIPFRLQDVRKDTAVGAEVSTSSIISKISLLTLHFPNLQIVWSKSPLHTAEIFRDLKKNIHEARPDPDPLKVQNIGKIGNVKFSTEQVDKDEIIGENAGLEHEADLDGQSLGSKLMPREFLKRIPGINSHNIAIIEKNVRNMIELVRMDEDKLAELIGAK